MKRWKNIYHANTDQKKAHIAKHVTHQADFRAGSVTRTSEEYLPTMKGLIIQEDATILNAYT